MVDTSNAEHFISMFYGYIVRNVTAYIPNNAPQVGKLLLKKVGNKIFHHYKKSITQIKSGDIPNPISNDELGELQYLSGYVIRKFLKQSQKQRNNTVALKILENMISSEDNDQELIRIQNRDGLTYVTATTQTIFLKAEETFRYQTSTVTNIKKIDT